ncbi:protein DpdG [Corallococcus sp. bb12-1]|uniref:protein DpdG n=1 Tax=Corallococcus sp. bb12-1 TaxID=2996784 RepID=UPI00226F4EDC|nr:protein DpdG [Corallococcus sp. bb12-1]MCY1045630.1 protein DpdG [Corallococcus sp. bb12-1]
MGILNLTSDGIPSALVALHGALRSFGPMPRNRLLALCDPPSLGGGRDLARRTLNRWTQLGAFVERGEDTVLAEPLKALVPGDLDGLRRELIKLVLRPENNPGIGAQGSGATGASDDNEESATEDEGESGRTTSLATDFTLATAWAFLQDPFIFSMKRDTLERLRNAQNPKVALLRNDTRWNGFGEWAPFLGMATFFFGGEFILSPAFAINGVLNEVFLNENSLPQATFLERIARALPVIDGGVYNVAMLELLGSPWRRLTPGEVSPCLSLALGQLQAAGTLRLLDLSDAPQRTLLGQEGRPIRTFTHVELGSR